jgi:hypothetical protein
MGAWSDRVKALRARARVGVDKIDKTPALPPPARAREAGQEDGLFPPRIRWGREMGWLNVRDPFTGEWHAILAREAPTGYAAIATFEKYEARSKLRVVP